MQRLKQITRSAKQTREFGKKLTSKLKKKDIVLVIGSMGSGKTTLIQGMAFGLGVKDQVTSPSFKIINEYKGILPFFHIDLYRIENNDELLEIGFEDYLYDSTGITAIEWAEKIKELWPEKRIEIYLKIISNNERELKIVDRRK